MARVTGPADRLPVAAEPLSTATGFNPILRGGGQAEFVPSGATPLPRVEIRPERSGCCNRRRRPRLAPCWVDSSLSPLSAVPAPLQRRARAYGRARDHRRRHRDAAGAEVDHRRKRILTARPGPSGSPRAAMSDWTLSPRGLNVTVFSSTRRTVILGLDRSRPSRALRDSAAASPRLFDHHRAYDRGRAVACGLQCMKDRRRTAS